MSAVKTLPEAVQRLYRFHWNPDATMPSRSGVYLTRTTQGAEWFRYFDASRRDWYLSWAERKNLGAEAGVRVPADEAAAQMAAWARCQRVAGH